MLDGAPKKVHVKLSTQACLNLINRILVSWPHGSTAKLARPTGKLLRDPAPGQKDGPSILRPLVIHWRLQPDRSGIGNENTVDWWGRWDSNPQPAAYLA